MSDLPTPRELLIALHAGLRAAPAVKTPKTAKTAPSSAPDGTAIANAAAVIAAAAALGARVLTLVDRDYPLELAGIAQPPPVLFVRGELPAAPVVAIVGSRLADGYGLEVAARFARHLAAAGVAVVSGLARGIDAAAHEGALSVPLGRTVAVLGCGMGVDYPPCHARLAAAIAARGALLSEFPCGTLPRPWCFPVRNRTIAALAAVTLVVQATPRSGSLATARHARELGRPVFAVPGPVSSPLSWGPHALLRRGALLAGHPEDILDALHTAPANPPAVMPAVCPDDADRETAPTTARTAATAGPAEEDAAAAAEDEAAAAEDEAAAAEIAVDGGSLLDASSSAAAAVLAALRPRASRRGRPQRSAGQVAALAGLEPEAVLHLLLELELAGEIERLHGLSYRLAKRAADGRRAAGAWARGPA
jgi:DNA processing protein